MEKIRDCGCKGCRTCLICEKDFGCKEKDFFTELKDQKSYVYCPQCNKLYLGWEVQKILDEHPSHNENGKDFEGVYVKLNFLSDFEEENLLKGIDEMNWVISQSGRRKQNFGPKTNFKKMKLAVGNFCGFPEFSKFVQDKLSNVKILNKFQTIEQCSLEYDPQRGASIDPHIDDCWIWGERVVTVNCLSDSVLTMASYKGDPKRYNLPLVDNYKTKLIGNLSEQIEIDKYNDIVIRIPMPRKSLIVLFGPARYQFEHSVIREDITERRVCVAYREFTPNYLDGGCDYKKGEPILNIAKEFWNHTISSLEN